MHLTPKALYRSQKLYNQRLEGASYRKRLFRESLNVARKTFLRRFQSILRMLCHLEDKSTMDNVFTVGEVVPYSGVHRIIHYPPHTGEEALTLTKGSTFPQCVHCSQVSFMLIRLEFYCGAENSGLSVSV